MKKTILTMSKKEVEIERMKLINEGLLADSSFKLDKICQEAEKLINEAMNK